MPRLRLAGNVAALFPSMSVTGCTVGFVPLQRRPASCAAYRLDCTCCLRKVLATHRAVSAGRIDVCGEKVGVGDSGGTLSAAKYLILRNRDILHSKDA